MYLVGICDDELVQVNIIQEYIQDICNEKEIDVEIFPASSGEELLKIANTQELDIVFLDIEMDGMDGLETGKMIRDQFEDVVIVFITGYKDYALESYEINAFNYIMKPLTRDKFTKIFLDTKKRVDEIRFINENEKNFIVKHKDGMLSLRYSDIFYFEKDSKNINVICQSDIFTYRSTIKDLKNMIESDDFIQCHQGYIINMNKITNRKESALVLGGIETIIPIGKTYRRPVIDAIEKRLLMR